MCVYVCMYVCMYVCACMYVLEQVSIAVVEVEVWCSKWVLLREVRAKAKRR